MRLTLLITVFFSNILVAFTQQHIQGESWEETSKNKKGTILIYWEESTPFIFKNENNQLMGIEYEIMEGLKKYLKDLYAIDLTITWVEGKGFANTFNVISNNGETGVFAASAFSITPAREKLVNFSPPYMADISVLISSMNVPIVKNEEEFNSAFSTLTAVTIKETTYEKELLKIKKEHNLPFTFTYIPSSSNILRALEGMNNAFGYIDLPVYLMMFNDNPTINVKRQNLLAVKRTGYGVIYPKLSDWSAPLNEYFKNKNFKPHLEKIITGYLDGELYHFIESIAANANNPVSLLTKEKEIQNKNILQKSQLLAKEIRNQNLLIILVAIISVCLILIILLYQKKNQQKEEIEKQRKNIEQKSDQLEKRNKHLAALDEEKNNLIRILALDLRTPINHIQGLSQVLLLETDSLEEDQKKMVQQITDSSIRLHKLVTGILDIDAIENERTQVLLEDVSLNLILNQILKDFKEFALRKNVSLVLDYTPSSCIAKGDPLFLMQIFQNLISNAIKFSPKEKQVVIVLDQRDKKILVSIKDDGVGFTEVDKEKLFKKFQRLNVQPGNSSDSTSLGLSIVKKYVESMNGRVWCESEVGKGSTFCVELESA